MDSLIALSSFRREPTFKKRIVMQFRSKSLFIKTFLLINALESAVVFYYLSSVSSDLKNAVFLGYSLSRLAMVGLTFILFVLFGSLFLRSSFSDSFLNRLIFHIDNISSTPFKRYVLNLFTAILVFLGAVLLLTPSDRILEYGIPIERIFPFVHFGIILGIQTHVGFFLWHGNKLNWRILFAWKKLFITTGIVSGFLVLVSLWVVRTRIGLQPELYGWHAPGTPVLFSQLFVAWLFGLLLIFWGNVARDSAGMRLKNWLPYIRLDLFICLVLWIGAFLVWWGEPMREESYFNPSPTPPNFEYYPYSDAALYDQSAQNLIIGADQNNKIILRPLYVFFLAFLHVIGGQKYDTVISFQILFLAVIPALAYLLTSQIGGRPAGLVTAILLIFREKNSIELTNVIEVSHSKLLMSDVPTMALMLLMTYVLIKWLKGSSTTWHLGIVAGASFGLVMLVRSHQAQFIIPALLIGLFFSGGFQLKRGIQRGLVFVLGFAAVVFPWVWRNDQVNGKPAIESSEFYISWYAGAYTEPSDTVDVLPGESPDEYSRRIRNQIIQYVIDHPAELARIYASYFVRNELDSVMYLPMSLKLYDPRSYVSEMKVWSDPLIDLRAGSILIFFVTLGLISLGIGAAFQGYGFLGLLPLFIHFTYNFSMSLARISGWRFVLPVDWIFLLYFCVGLIHLTIILSSMIGIETLWLDVNQDLNESPAEGLAETPGKALLYFALFLIMGLALPLTEKIIPGHFVDLSPDQLASRFVADGPMVLNENVVTLEELKGFLETESDAKILTGRALYPSFYKAGDFWGDQQSATYLARDFNRLHFTLIGQKGSLVFLPMDLPPDYFPHASDVFVLGCETSGGIRALAVKIKDQPAFVTTSPWHGLTCFPRK